MRCNKIFCLKLYIPSQTHFIQLYKMSNYRIQVRLLMKSTYHRFPKSHFVLRINLLFESHLKLISHKLKWMRHSTPSSPRRVRNKITLSPFISSFTLSRSFLSFFSRSAPRRCHHITHFPSIQVFLSSLYNFYPSIYVLEKNVAPRLSHCSV